MGRPRNPHGTQLRNRVQALLSDEEYLRHLEASREMGSSAWIRSLICRELDLPLDRPAEIVEKSRSVPYDRTQFRVLTWEHFVLNLADGLLSDQPIYSLASEGRMSQERHTPGDLVKIERAPWMTHVVVHP